jgi:hypothetical protein
MTDETQHDAQDNDKHEAPKGFMSHSEQSMLGQLRKLQHHFRSNVSAEIAQKSQGSFDVHMTPGERGTQGIDAPVSLLVYPQDPFVSDPEVRELPAEDVQSGLVNSRIRIRDSRYPVAQPDEDNNYLYWAGTPEFNQVNAFYYATLTLRMFEKLAHRRLAWAFTSPRLKIDPHAGDGTNALYNEDDRSLGFFSFDFNGESFNTAQNADVVVHETAHAVMDGLRDLYNESFGMGPLAFHESFGDMAAVLVALHDDSLVWKLLQWTDGDLRVGNFVSEVAEHLVSTIKSLDEMAEIGERTVYLRNALNKFTDVRFDDMVYFPQRPGHTLGRESHNYSRLFTGAFYDLLVALYEYIRDEQQAQPRIAIHRARDLVGSLLVYAVELGPVGELTFADMARAFLTADVLLHSGQHTDTIASVFAARGILSEAEATAHLDSLRALPEIMLPNYVDSALEAGIFLVETVQPALNLPDVEYTPMSAHRNQRGFAFLTYFTSRRLVLAGPEYGAFEGVAVDVFGGVTLAFNSAGRMVSALDRPVTDEDIRQVQIMTMDLIQHGLVTEQSVYGRGKVLSDEIRHDELPSVQPRLLYLHDLPTTDGGERFAKLVRVPVILDAVPPRRENFVEYLRSWMGESS